MVFAPSRLFFRATQLSVISNIYCVLVLIASLSLCGCIHKSVRNNFPVVVDKKELTAIKDLINDYRSKPGDVTKEKRNNLVERLVGVSDDHYFKLRDSLLNSRNTTSFVGEMTSTTLSAVSALLGDVDTKSILSTASTLSQATKTSIDKNFFSDKSTEIIVAKMDALRAEKRQIITSGEGDELSQYGLETAFNDVRSYDDAGTIETALIALAADASTNKGTAEQNLFNLKLKVQ